MIKKILGVIFIPIASILSLSFLIGLPKIILMLFSSFSAYNIGYTVTSLFFLGLSIFLFKLGIKWIKNKPKTVDTMNEIGKN